MRIFRLGFLPVLLSLTFLSGCNPKEPAPLVYASFSQVVTSSSLAHQELDRLNTVKKILDAGAQSAEKRYALMPADKAAQARQADAQLLNAQWIAEQQHARAVVLIQVRKAADELLKKEGYGMILDQNAIFAGSPEKDVSKALVAALKDAKPDFGTLPVVSAVKDENIDQGRSSQ